MMVKLCSNCGTHNLASSWNCNNCGQTLSVTMLVEVDDSSVKLNEVPESEKDIEVTTQQPERGTKLCAECNTDNLVSSEYCKNCGRGLFTDIPEQAEDLNWFQRHRVITGIMIGFAVGFMLQFLQDFDNPYLTTYKIMMRALIQGVGMVFVVTIAYAVSKAASKLFSDER